MKKRKKLTKSSTCSAIPLPRRNKRQVRKASPPPSDAPAVTAKPDSQKAAKQVAKKPVKKIARKRPASETAKQQQARAAEKKAQQLALAQKKKRLARGRPVGGSQEGARNRTGRRERATCGRSGTSGGSAKKALRRFSSRKNSGLQWRRRSESKI